MTDVTEPPWVAQKKRPVASLVPTCATPKTRPSLTTGTKKSLKISRWARGASSPAGLTEPVWSGSVLNAISGDEGVGGGGGRNRSRDRGCQRRRVGQTTRPRGPGDDRGNPEQRCRPRGRGQGRHRRRCDNDPDVRLKRVGGRVRRRERQCLRGARRP